jgi:hypothetical protein
MVIMVAAPMGKMRYIFAPLHALTIGSVVEITTQGLSPALE